MGELRTTQAGVVVRLDAGRALRSTHSGALVRCRAVGAPSDYDVRATQAGALVRLAPPEAHVSQAGALVRLALVQIRTSQAGVLVRCRVPPMPRPGKGAAAAGAARTGGERLAAPASTAAGISRGVMAQAAPAVMAAQAGAVVGLAEKRAVAGKIEIDWAGAGLFTDESANLISVKGSSNLTAPQQALSSGKGMIDRCTIQLHNRESRYSTLNEQSPLAPYIGAGEMQAAPVRVSVTIDGVTHRLFTGVIRSLQEEAPTPTSGAQVTLDCRSRDDLLLQQKLSTTLADWLTASSVGRTEDWHILHLLQAAGLVDGADFVSQAYAASHPGAQPTVDNGVFPLRYVWLDDESPLEEMWEVAAACCGWFYADGAGLLHYHNLSGLLDEMMARHYGALTQIDITEENSAKLALTWRDNDLFSEVTVEASILEMGAAGAVWATETPITLEPGESKTLYAKLNQPQTAALTLTWSARSVLGADLSAAVSLTRTDYAQRVKLVWTNSSSRTAYATAALTGQTLLRGDMRESVASVASDDAFWASRAPRSRAIRGNLYVQGETQAATVARYVLDRSQRPQLVASITNLDRADVRVGRRCSVRYAGVMGQTTEFAGLVMASTWSLQASGFRQSVEIFDVTRLFVADRPFFILGTNRLGAAGTATAKLFY